MALSPAVSLPAFTLHATSSAAAAASSSGAGLAGTGFGERLGGQVAAAADRPSFASQLNQLSQRQQTQALQQRVQAERLAAQRAASASAALRQTASTRTPDTPRPADATARGGRAVPDGTGRDGQRTADRSTRGSDAADRTSTDRSGRSSDTQRTDADAAARREARGAAATTRPDGGRRAEGTRAEDDARPADGENAVDGTATADAPDGATASNAHTNGPAGSRVAQAATGPAGASGAAGATGTDATAAATTVGETSDTNHPLAAWLAAWSPADASADGATADVDADAASTLHQGGFDARGRTGATARAGDPRGADRGAHRTGPLDPTSAGTTSSTLADESASPLRRRDAALAPGDGADLDAQLLAAAGALPATPTPPPAEASASDGMDGASEPATGLRRAPPDAAARRTSTGTAPRDPLAVGGDAGHPGTVTAAAAKGPRTPAGLQATSRPDAAAPPALPAWSSDASGWTPASGTVDPALAAALRRAESAPGGRGEAMLPEPAGAVRGPEAAAGPSRFAGLLDAAGQAQQAQGAMAGGPAVGAAGAPVEVTLPTLVTSPDFQEALGAQVSVLAQDGVQQAELHLNPGDMGPISVRITLDGTQAQVDFGVDSATTRALVEAGMPELAGALREAGLTLTGGGVSQHPRGQGDGGQPRDGDGGARRDRGPGAGGSDAAAPVATRRIASRGNVDLYA